MSKLDERTKELQGDLLPMPIQDETEDGICRRGPVSTADTAAPFEEYLTFPDQAYMGVAKDFAELYASYLGAPKQFLYLDFLAFLGAMVCPYVKMDTEVPVTTRLYTIKVGKSDKARKSFSQDKTKEFFDPICEPRLRVCRGVGSPEGLAGDITNAPSVEDGKLPFLLMYDELQSFVSKARIQGSVLLPAVTTLFDLGEYENVTKDSRIRIRGARLSIIGACTKDTFENMFSPAFRDIGFLNRLFIVTGESTSEDLPERIPNPEKKKLRKRTKEIIDWVAQEKPFVTFDADAKELWNQWHRQIPDSPYTHRLPIYGLRFLLLLTVLQKKTLVDRPLVEAVLSLLDYQFRVRRELDPVDAENPVAKIEARIMKNLKKGPMTDSRLQDYCHVRRYGTWPYDTATKNLAQKGWVAKMTAGRGVRWMLTDAGKEAAERY